MKFNKKLIWYSLPILVGGFLIYKQFSKGKNKNEDVPLPPLPPAPIGGGGGGVPSSDFPLRKGSKNDMVGSLQSLLNTALACKTSPLLVVDNNFGTKTEAALNDLTGKKSVSSASDFESVKKQLASFCALSKNLDWGWKLIEAQNTGRYSVLIVNKPVELYKVVKDFRGLWVSSVPAKALILNPTQYSLKDYVLRSALTDGRVRLEITRGDNAGMWLTKSGIDLQTSLNVS